MPEWCNTFFSPSFDFVALFGSCASSFLLEPRTDEEHRYGYHNHDNPPPAAIIGLVVKETVRRIMGCGTEIAAVYRKRYDASSGIA